MGGEEQRTWAEFMRVGGVGTVCIQRFAVYVNKFLTFFKTDGPMCVQELQNDTKLYGK